MVLAENCSSLKDIIISPVSTNNCMTFSTEVAAVASNMLLTFTVNGVMPGEASITVFLTEDPSVNVTFYVTVSEPSTI